MSHSVQSEWLKAKEESSHFSGMDLILEKNEEEKDEDKKLPMLHSTEYNYFTASRLYIGFSANLKSGDSKNNGLSSIYLFNRNLRI